MRLCSRLFSEREKNTIDDEYEMMITQSKGNNFCGEKKEVILVTRLDVRGAVKNPALGLSHHIMCGSSLHYRQRDVHPDSH